MKLQLAKHLSEKYLVIIIRSLISDEDTEDNDRFLCGGQDLRAGGGLLPTPPILFIIMHSGSEILAPPSASDDIPGPDGKEIPAARAFTCLEVL